MAALTIVGILVALLLPAILHARESARRVFCQNNLRQSAIAIQLFHDSRKRLPSLYNGSFDYNGSTISYLKKYWGEHHFHLWQTALLSHLEQSTLYDRLNTKLAACSASNQLNVKIELSVFICPSTNYYTRYRRVQQYAPNVVIGIAARSDYEAIGGIYVASERIGKMLSNIKVDQGVWALPQHVIGRSVDHDESYRAPKQTRFSEVLDGLSNTIVIGEMAGRPDIYIRGKLDSVYGSANRPIIHSNWAISGHYGSILLDKNPRVNQTNDNGLYSFHVSGANVAFADGSVRLLADSTGSEVLHAMATKARLA